MGWELLDNGKELQHDPPQPEASHSSKPTDTLSLNKSSDRKNILKLADEVVKLVIQITRLGNCVCKLFSFTSFVDCFDDKYLSYYVIDNS